MMCLSLLYSLVGREVMCLFTVPLIAVRVGALEFAVGIRQLVQVAAAAASTVWIVRGRWRGAS